MFHHKCYESNERKNTINLRVGFTAKRALLRRMLKYYSTSHPAPLEEGFAGRESFGESSNSWKDDIFP